MCRSLLIKAVDLVVWQLEPEITRQPKQHIRVRLQGGDQPGRWSVAHELCDVRQNLAVCRGTAAPMGGAHIHQPERRNLDRLIQGL